MASISSQPAFADILRNEETFAVEGDTSMENQLNSWFDALLVQSGLGLAPSLLVGLSIVVGLSLGGLVFVWQENLLTAAIAATIGFLIPIAFTVFWRNRRQRIMSRQLPGAIDELARAAKTGRSLENCLTLVANDTPSPLGSELRNCTRKLALGLNVDEALNGLPSRTGLVGTSVLGTALSVHRQSGGDLVKVLERLSQTLRDRNSFIGKLNAATAASRATAILMIVLPPAILAFFIFRDPEYLSRLFASTWGARITISAFVLQIVGAIWVLAVLNNSEKG